MTQIQWNTLNETNLASHFTPRPNHIRKHKHKTSGGPSSCQPRGTGFESRHIYCVYYRKTTSTPCMAIVIRAGISTSTPLPLLLIDWLSAQQCRWPMVCTDYDLKWSGVYAECLLEHPWLHIEHCECLALGKGLTHPCRYGWAAGQDFSEVSEMVGTREKGKPLQITHTSV